MDPHHTFTTIDYIVIGTILFSGLLALMRGLLREVFSLLAWAGAYFAATKFYIVLVPFLHPYIHKETAVEWASMAAMFCLAMLLLTLLGFAICSLIKGRALTSIDRSLGFLFGLLRGGLIVCLVYLVSTLLLWPDIDQPRLHEQPETHLAADQQQAKTQEPTGHWEPPEGLLHARTRPLLASGAHLIEGIIPQKLLDETLKKTKVQLDETLKKKKQDSLDAMTAPPTPTTDHSPDAP